MTRSPRRSVASLPQPFYSSLANPNETKRLLLVSAAFPPDASIGGMRWGYLLDFAAARGWGADVLMLDPAQVEMRDEALMAHVAAGVRIFGVPLREHPLLLAERRLRRTVSSAISRTRGRIELSCDHPAPASLAAEPGEEIGTLRSARRSYLARLYYAQWADWAGRVSALGSALAREKRYSLVVSSGPPNMAHEAARSIAVHARLPLALDLRDPWSADYAAPPDYRSRAWRQLTAKFERRCMEAADLIILNTPAAEQLYRELYPSEQARLMCAMNGADAGVNPTAHAEWRFLIAHTGDLYQGRDPRPLFRAASEVVRRLGLTPDEFGVHFMGSEEYAGRPLAAIAQEEGIGPYFAGEGRRPRREAHQLCARAAMLVLLPQIQIHCIPGKTFEFVQFDAWLLALTRPGDAVEMLLKGTQADTVSPDDVTAIAEVIQRRVEAFRTGVRPVRLNRDGRYDRRHQAALLLERFNALLSR